MVKVRLEYTGLHMPKEIVEVKDTIASGLILRGDYKPVDVQKEDTSKFVCDEEGCIDSKPHVHEKPNMSWSEKEIKQWMFDNKVDIEYNIKKETKSNKLKELKDDGWI